MLYLIARLALALLVLLLQAAGYDGARSQLTSAVRLLFERCLLS